jgi:hypothetical protein
LVHPLYDSWQRKLCSLGKRLRPWRHLPGVTDYRKFCELSVFYLDGDILGLYQTEVCYGARFFNPKLS